MNNNPTRSVWANMDWLTALLVFLLMFVGWINIYSSEYSNTPEVFNFSSNHGKELIWIFGAFALMLFIFLLDYRIFHTIAYLLYAIAIALLLVTLVIGKVVAGAKGWLSIGGFQLQTAEIAKFATAMALAKYLSTHGVDISRPRDKFMAFAIFMFPCLLVLAQNDTGSAMVFLAFTFVLYRQGLNGLYILIPVYIGVLSVMVLVFDKIPVLVVIGLLTAAAVALFYKQGKILILLLLLTTISSAWVFGLDYAVDSVLKPYQKQRIEVLLGKVEDTKGAGYNVHQSLIAIGSGGTTGKGFLNGTQTKFNFVPEQSTDFIFCTIGEEYGFLGSATLMLLYLFLLYKVITIAERQKFIFNRCYAYGVFAIIFFHFTINISMTLGLFPVIGIPLPFISYGGSALIAFSALIFVLLKLDAANKEY